MTTRRFFLALPICAVIRGPVVLECQSWEVLQSVAATLPVPLAGYRAVATGKTAHVSG
jgi:hypothetical protein